MKKHGLLVVVLSLFLMLALSLSAGAVEDLSNFPSEVDPQSWKLYQDMTWNDWLDNPVTQWKDAELSKNVTVHHGALILVEFADRPFIITQPKGSDQMGNPMIDPVPQSELGQWWADFLNTPSAINHYTSIDSFWRENSYGNWRVEMTAFGPYKLEGMEWEYGAPGSKRYLAGEAFEALFNDPKFLAYKGGLTYFNFSFILHAGYDESGIWEEAGSMLFSKKEDVPAAFGPTREEIAAMKAWAATADENGKVMGYNWAGANVLVDTNWTKPLTEDGANWGTTRYVEWSSWLATKSVWSTEHFYKIPAEYEAVSGLKAGETYRISIQGESDGMATFAHEFGHITFLPDNYNNPYGKPDTRSYTGGWELMSRGSFVGPEGAHTRWQVPSANGGSTPAHHTVRMKWAQDFYDDDMLLVVPQKDLVQRGPVFADVVARTVPAGKNGVGYGCNALVINLTEDKTPIVPKKLENGDPNPAYTWTTSTFGEYTKDTPYYGKGYYQMYGVEVVQRASYESFAADKGVLITMARALDASDYDHQRSPMDWVIDSHPADIAQVDYIAPDGSPSMVSLGDMRQLNDALFHEGVGKDVVSEYVDEYNSLHFYILDKKYDEKGVLSYRVAVRSTTRDPYRRQVTAEAAAVSGAAQGMVAVQEIKVSNPGSHTDLYRLSVTNTGKWETALTNEVIEVPAGAAVTVPVYLKVPVSGLEPTELTFVATSEMDSKATAQVTATVQPSEMKVPFTDMRTVDWFYNDVVGAWQLDLVNGRTLSTYVPAGNITLAEAVKLAACMNQLYTEGKVSLTNGEKDWYSTYVDYAVSKGIVRAGEYTNLNAMATRAQFASIFAAALPEHAYTQINDIGNDQLPDVKSTDSYGPQVIKLYKAGVLTGNDAEGTFAPMTNIKRSEVAAIVNRMMHEELRKPVNL